MRKKRIQFIPMGLILCVLLPIASMAQRTFVHPGISHKQSDLQRMKIQVEAGKEPWVETYELMQNSSYASYNYNVQGNPTNTTITSHTPFINDGYGAYYNALMWNITGDERHAQKAVEIFNAWVNITRIEDQFPLNNGRGPWKMLEGAEIIKSTYSGWAQADIEQFKAMLVYPGWSGTTVPTAAIASQDVSFYWNIYQGDPARHGNQGLFAYRSMMAMAIFLDNEIMYDRALRYLQGLSHRTDDLPYPSGPPVLSGRQDSSNEYYDEFKQYSRSTTVQDYGYNEAIENYIWENGQCQESSRDQAHGLGGVSITACMCEMAWNQGDDLYGHLDNRVLLGFEYYFRYNLSYEHTYPDQLTAWEPTVESGEFIQRSDRTGRWKSLKINPWRGADLTRWERGQHNLNGIYEMNLGHYKDRLLLPPSETKWLERGFDLMTETIGVEDDANPNDHPGWGGIKFRRVSPGDPISGFDANDVPVFGIHTVPSTIEAEHYDHFAINGESRTYHDNSTGNSGNQYRTDDVDVGVCSEGGYALTDLEEGEWVSYTVNVSEAGKYSLTVRYAGEAEGTVRFAFDGTDVTGDVILPTTGSPTIWNTHVVGQNISLVQGAQSMRISISGPSGAYNLSSVTLSLDEAAEPSALHIEAEDYDEQSGIDTESCSDIGGGENVGFISDGDWCRYDAMMLGTNTILSARVARATGRSDGKIEVRLDSPTGTLVGSVDVPETGDWQAWKTITTTLDPVAGEHSVYLTFVEVDATTGGSIFNLNWFELEASSGRYQAEDYDTQSGTETETCSDDLGGENLGYIDDGDWCLYNNITLGPNTVFSARIARPSGRADGIIEVRLNSTTGTLIGSVEVPETGGWQEWETVETILDPVEGTHSLVLVFVGGGSSLFNFNWFDLDIQETLVPPTGLTAAPATASQIDLEWNSMDGISEYHLKRATVSGGPYDQMVIGPALPRYTDSGLLAGTNYYYVVSVMSDGVESVNSTEIAAVPSAALYEGDVVISDVEIAPNGSGGQNVTVLISASELGHRYQVVSSESLAQPVWLPASSSFSGNGEDLLIEVPLNAAQTNHFYKLEAWRQ